MQDSIFELEQDIMKAWNLVDDVELLYNHFGNDPKFKGLDAKAEDELINLLLGIRSLSTVRFEALFKTYEAVTRDYHSRGNQLKAEKASNLKKIDEITELKEQLRFARQDRSWPENSDRVDNIGRNGNDGLHYSKIK